MSKNRKPPRGPNQNSGVGYRRPPKHSRFKRGTSGNPTGRPKGTRNFKTDVKKTLTSPVKLTRDGRTQWISTQEAALLRLREKAIGLDVRALDRLIKLAEVYNNEELVEEQTVSESDAAILEIYKQRVLREAAAASDVNNVGGESSEPDHSNKSGSPNESTDQSTTGKDH